MQILDDQDVSDEELVNDWGARFKRVKRRRLAVVAVVQQAARIRSLSAGGRLPNTHRERDRVLAKVSKMSDRVFMRHFRLCREDFYAVLDLVRRDF